jgi:AcrR family transcriptional regulator
MAGSYRISEHLMWQGAGLRVGPKDLDRPRLPLMVNQMSDERAVEILRHVVDLLRVRGYASLRLDEVAALSRTSKATLYRRWNSKASLVASALSDPRSGGWAIDFPNTGSLLGDLHAGLDLRGDQMSQLTMLTAAVHFALLHDEDLGTELRRRGGLALMGSLQQVIERAVDRGEIAADHPVLEVLPTLIVAPAILQPLVAGSALAPERLHDLADDVLGTLLGLPRHRADHAQPPRSEAPEPMSGCPLPASSES